MATQRLWLTEPRRATSLSKVIAVRGAAFALDRSLFAPTSHVLRHPQPADTGIVWTAGGEKRALVRSFERDGMLWHVLRGTTPELGTTLNCQLDQDRRFLTSRAHTAMHLVLAAMGRDAPRLVADPTVKGGGTFRLDLDGHVAAPTLAAWLTKANGWVATRAPVRMEYLARDGIQNLVQPQAFVPPDPYPGPETSLSVARIEGVGAYPCDGTHVERLDQVGRIVFKQVRSHGTRTSLIGGVMRPA